MTRWGLLLLLAYVGFGLSGAARGKALRLAAGVTVIVLAIVMSKTGALR